MRSGCQQRSIDHRRLRPRDLAAQNLKLVPQHQQLNVSHVQAAAATNKRTQQRPKRKVKEGEGHAADPANLRPGSSDTDIGALQAIEHALGD
ncbi:MAG: hypothetical protein ACREVB_02380 [Burkholderiales bacterium]